MLGFLLLLVLRNRSRLRLKRQTRKSQYGFILHFFYSLLLAYLSFICRSFKLPVPFHLLLTCRCIDQPTDPIAVCIISRERTASIFDSIKESRSCTMGLFGYFHHNIAVLFMAQKPFQKIASYFYRCDCVFDLSCHRVMSLSSSTART